MKAHIYQIMLCLNEKPIFFMPYDALMRECGGHFPATCYEHVYSMDFPEEDPEAVYELLNLHRPADYKARSFSVSDIVEFERDDGSQIAYYCDSIGFKTISFDRDAIYIPAP